MEVKKRIEEYIDYKGISTNKMQSIAGLSSSYWRNTKSISAEVLVSILSAFDDLSAEWVIRGKGSMLLGEEHIINEYRESQNNVEKSERLEVVEVEEVPVISQELARATNTDIVEYIEENKESVQFDSIVKSIPTHDALFQVLTNSMDPYISKGDWLALKKLPDDVEIIEGEYYMIDANQGCLVRRMYKKDCGVYIAEASHPSYPSVILRREEINNLFCIAAVVKFSITPASITLKDFHKLEDNIKELNSERQILLEENKKQGERIDVLLNMMRK